MGNSNSVVCCVSPSREIYEQCDDTYQVGQSERSSVTPTMKKVREDEGYSFSSLSDASSRNKRVDKEQECAMEEMRNDAGDWHKSLSDEIRVAVSSYDEATTEAVNQYYGDSRYAIQQNERRDDS